MLSKFQKVQKWISFVPFWSTIFIAIVTYIELSRKRASAVFWVKYGANFFISAVVVTSVNGIMSGDYIILNLIASALLLVLTNFYFIHLQVEVSQKEYNKEQSKSNNKDKLKSFIKKHEVVLMIIPAALFVIAVTVFVCYRLMYSLMVANDKKIEDTNGANDYSVVMITDEEIATNIFGDYTAFAFGSSNDGSQSDIEDYRLEDVDYDETVFTARSLSGIYIANVTKTDFDCVSYKITSTVESGNAEIFVFVDDILCREIDINDTTEFLLTDVSGKTVYVKAACEDARISINVEREILS